MAITVPLLPVDSLRAAGRFTGSQEPPLAASTDPEVMPVRVGARHRGTPWRPCAGAVGRSAHPFEESGHVVGSSSLRDLPIALPSGPLQLTEEDAMTDPRQPDVVQTASGLLHVSEVEEERVSDNPVIHHISVYRTRARMMSDARVEQRAREMHAASSYTEWDSLSDTDQELWRHMARIELC
jgi:hypothetical protein